MARMTRTTAATAEEDNSPEAVSDAPMVEELSAEEVAGTPVEPKEIEKNDEFDGVPEGKVVEKDADAKKFLKDGVFSETVYKKIYPMGSRRPTYVLLGSKGSVAAQ